MEIPEFLYFQKSRKLENTEIAEILKFWKYAFWNYVRWNNMHMDLYVYT